MLEIRYKINTGIITACVGSPEFIGGHLESKAGEKIIVIDRPALTYSPEHYLVVAGELKLIKEPKPPRDLAVEIDEIKTKLDKAGLI